MHSSIGRAISSLVVPEGTIFGAQSTKLRILSYLNMELNVFFSGYFPVWIGGLWCKVFWQWETNFL
jgi:hypothetical protein